MELNENLVTEVTENVEQTTEETVEQPVKTYTEDEVNQIVGKRLARREAKIRKEYNRKYGELENVLRAGTGVEDVEGMTSTFRDFYQKKGIQIPTEPTYSNRDIEVLARAEADEIISAGLEEVIEEVDRLADLGAENMSPRERAVFKTLAEYRQNAERGRELSKIGVTEDVYTSKEFKDFAGKFSANTPVAEIYDIYAKTQPKKEIRTMGSMKTNSQPDNGVKEFYTFEEASRFSQKEINSNPKLYDAIVRSMQKWGK